MSTAKQSLDRVPMRNFLVHAPTPQIITAHYWKVVDGALVFYRYVGNDYVDTVAAFGSWDKVWEAPPAAPLDEPE